MSFIAKGLYGNIFVRGVRNLETKWRLPNIFKYKFSRFYDAQEKRACTYCFLNTGIFEATAARYLETKCLQLKIQKFVFLCFWDAQEKYPKVNNTTTTAKVLKLLKCPKAHEIVKTVENC